MIRWMICAMGSELAITASSDAEDMSSRERLGSMLQIHFRIVWRTLRRLGLAEAEADDAAQQVFMIAGKRLAEVERGKERAFLIGTAYRVAANTRRKDLRRPETGGDVDFERQAHSGPSPEELVERKRWRELLDIVLDSMPIDLRTVFVLFELEGLSSPEIATALSIPLGTVASRLRRSREAFEKAAERLRAEHAAGGER